MKRHAIHTLGAPKAIGPYSQAIQAGVQEMIFCSGQVGLDPATMELVPGGVEAETKQALSNLHAVLEAAHLSFGAVVKTTVFLADMADFAKMNTVYASFFSGEPPARSTVAAAGLPRGARVEIEAIAVR